MFRKPVFWLLLVAASLGSGYFAVRYFSRAFPIVTLDLRMDRQAALSSAAQLAAKFQLPPSDYRQAASFGGDQEVQNFVELEGGGTAAFKAMMAEGLYHPYKWSVRHFKPGETRETVFTFTPRGAPYGFAVKLPESEAGAALDAAQARAIAEQSAARDWKIDLGQYRLVEQSREVRPGGRIDHAFVYERPDVKVGEGRYRLRLVVAGDRLTELTHSVKVPEAFSRRYEQMRSANNVLSIADTIAFVFLYLIGGCGVGLFFLLRRRWVIWRKPLMWGVFIAFLQLLAGINQWPLVWMSYDTALSAQGFVMQQILALVGSFLLYALLFTVSFMAAESLSRRAFPNHIQQWKLWSADIAGSRAVLGRTAAGYLLVAVFFGYEVLLYFITTRSLHWWTPSDALVQPDVLATWFPWLTAIALPAQAGFWEESLFRAVPIAGAALLGTRFGKRAWWIAGAMVLQALIFGSGHAGYATQPFYARLTELIIPSFMFGGLYIFFGLLPAIVLHFTFDAVWFALPLFVSTASGIGLDRTLAVLLVLVPLWITLGARLRAGKWREVPEALLNRAWQPAEAAGVAAAPEAPAPQTSSRAVARGLPIAGILGLALWAFATSFKPDAPPLAMSRHEATAAAEKALQDRGVRLDGPWKTLTAVEGQPGQQDRFVWQTAGKEVYRQLMNDYLAPPHWRVRFARFEGDVAERAEEYQVFISDARRVFRFRHTLPEEQAAESLTEGNARVLAHDTLKKEFGIDPSAVKEVSAVPSKLKARTDWVFTFSAEGGVKLPQGDKRIGIRISGGQVSDAYRFVHVPEEWARQERDRQAIPSITGTACTILLVLAGIAGLVAAIVSWSRKHYIVSSFLWLFALVLGLNLINLINTIPSISAQFSTAQPYKVQMFILLAVGVIGMVLQAAGLGLNGGLVHRWCLDDATGRPPSMWIAGLSLGGFAAGVLALGAWLGPSLAPRWTDSAYLDDFVPIFGKALGPVAGYFAQAILALLVFAALNRYSRKWSRRRWLFGILLFLFGLVAAGAGSVETIPSWLAAGAAAGGLMIAAYLLLLRFSPAQCLIAVGVIQVLGVLRQGIASWPIAWTGSVLAAVLVGLAAWFLYARVTRAEVAIYAQAGRDD